MTRLNRNSRRQIAPLREFLTSPSRGGATAAALLGILSASFGWANPVYVTTYHGDGQRTGWNSQETILTPSALRSSPLTQVASVNLDAQVDAQPLYVGAQTIAGQGQHNVIYTVTENNTVYAIDADSGAILMQRNFGSPLGISQLPGQCSDNSNIVGITATPVIDVNAQALYVITYTYENNAPVYRLHALDLGSLTDRVAPTVISGTASLYPSGSQYTFNPSVSRSRPALLLSNGVVYAAFASFCDFNANLSRGWLLGWNAATLAPISQPALLNRESQTTNTYFLTGVWMSGYGISVDAAGSLFVVTGNSDPAGTAYKPPYGIAESVVKLSPDLTTIQSIFTPAGGSGADYATLEAGDQDFGAGGALILPPQPGAYPHIAVAAGKYGAMYLLNSDDLGGYNQGLAPYLDRILNSYTIGTCFCGQSYYKGADGIGRVVSSGGNTAVVWKVNTGGTPTLTRESTSAALVNGDNDGFFTTISSNGTTAGSQIVWALGRPINTSPGTVTLYAFDPSTINGSGQMATLFSGGAGSWPQHGHANLVPTVANGKVYVGTYKQLTIFATSNSPPPPPPPPPPADIVSFAARGTPAGGVYPVVKVIVDGKQVGSTSVTGTTATYSFNASFAPNVPHDVQIQYGNDTVISGQDRNLYLSSIGIDAQVVSAKSPYEVYHSKIGGGPGDIPSSGNMYWNGTAEFSLPASLFPTRTQAKTAANVAAVAKKSAPAFIQGDPEPALPGHAIWGTLTAMRKGSLTLRTRSGLVTVDNAEALKTHHSMILQIGDAVVARGEYDGAGVLHARSVQRTQRSRELWGSDD